MALLLAKNSWLPSPTRRPLSKTKMRSAFTTEAIFCAMMIVVVSLIVFQTLREPIFPNEHLMHSYYHPKSKFSVHRSLLEKSISVAFALQKIAAALGDRRFKPSGQFLNKFTGLGDFRCARHLRF